MLVARILASLFALSLIGCPSWSSELRDGNFANACRLAEEIDDPREERRARAAVSRAYTERSRLAAALTESQQDVETSRFIDDSKVRVVSLRAGPPVELRALRIDREIWLPVPSADISAALAQVVGLDVADDSSPVARAFGEAADRYVKDASKGGLDPKLRERTRGVIPVCREQKDCKPRREAFKKLNRLFVASADCRSDDCERHYLLRRTWDADGPSAARVQIQWEIEGCRVEHFSDIAPFESVGPAELSGEWMPADPPLRQCTYHFFDPDECRARVE